ncbi:MAG: CocE/NonD family hydrolase, partial [Fimbriimonadales bacterium]
SYNGFCVWMAAKTKPRWLKTAISVVPMPGSPYGEPWDGGIHYVGGDLGWFGLLRDRAKVQPFNDDQTAAINTLPISDADKVQFGHSVPGYGEMLRPERFDAQVQRSSYLEAVKGIDIPVLYFDGWLDTVALGTRLNYATMVSHGAKNQKLIWGPWNHFTNQESRDGVTDFSPDGYVDMRTITLRWFDRWLKDMPNGIDREPSVDEFILGENRWVHGDAWPPKEMRPQRWFLQPAGALDPRMPGRSEPSKYVYDPAKYVYSNANSASYFFSRGDDATALCKGAGQLLFDSAPLRRPIRLDGPIRGRLYASTNARDTDWAMALLDVHPDGQPVVLAAGMIRARFRKSFAHPQLLRPGENYGYDLDMWQMGITIPAGHRLRVVVCSTFFPDSDRNLNTGEPFADAVRMVVANQNIYHDSEHPSYIELPVVPK